MTPAPAPPLRAVPELARWRLHLEGSVQGVGFRPHCLREARALGLSGWVRNGADGLWLEAQGPRAQLDALLARLRDAPPPLARVDRLSCEALPPRADETGFRIDDSDARAALTTGLPADAAVCADCLRELFDPADRRYRYPFINCTQCGPRYTLVRALPYDRPATSMAAFALCPACRREYDEPADRRHHAQPNACPACGPRLAWHDADGLRVASADPLAAAVAALRAGAVVAVRGVGGFHLVCDAQRTDTVARLRAAKQRPGKPFAVLALNATSLRRWLTIDAGAAALLESPARPIVLLPRRADVAADALDAALAPALGEWGAMLPAHPLHWLLLHEWLGRPAGDGWRDAACDALFVVTSANPAGEPLVTGNDEAFAQLRGLADAYLVHDREIVARCDDSVRRPLGVDAQGRLHAPFVRRARGYVPDPIVLHGVPADAPPVLACGGWLKNAICVTRGNEAFLSPHIGDLDTRAACAALDEMVTRLTGFLGVRPRAVAHDRHPDFYSTRAAAALAARWRVPAFAVQHHAAHLAAVRAEHALDGALDGLILDGSGLGDDGTIWGGEWLRLGADGTCTRRGHLPALTMAGGDAAAREPWRMAAAVLHGLGRGDEIARRYAAQPAAPAVARLLGRGLYGVPSSSAGRAFDAAAALLGIAERNAHEADAAMRLEACAARARAAGVAPRPLPAGAGFDVLWTRLLDTDRDDADAVARAALDFHDGLAALALAPLLASRPAAVALGGGCLINRLLRDALLARLRAACIAACEAMQAPPGDGGLALGQAWIASRRLAASSIEEN
ncbi:carbamoyltransferase HypF [Solimonas variicoloris]|uniref:carbamoyltransferase HypF n=1 Tax=Solimonas variicoloris TaxID=254408 RepID=UPI000364F8F8|nr:carbamoyltransferase HypF [Solimonas variicoloris]